MPTTAVPTGMHRCRWILRSAAHRFCSQWWALQTRQCPRWSAPAGGHPWAGRGWVGWCSCPAPACRLPNGLAGRAAAQHRWARWQTARAVAAGCRLQEAWEGGRWIGLGWGAFTVPPGLPQQCANKPQPHYASAGCSSLTCCIARRVVPRRSAWVALLLSGCPPSLQQATGLGGVCLHQVATGC